MILVSSLNKQCKFTSSGATNRSLYQTSPDDAETGTCSLKRRDNPPQETVGAQYQSFTAGKLFESSLILNGTDDRTSKTRIDWFIVNIEKNIYSAISLK